MCNMYMGLGARGISILYASGDGGVRGGHDSPSQCSLTTFIPVFPSTCPYVTTVGATIGVQPEIAMNLTGGGFSNYFAAPSYQKSAIAQFKASLPSNFGGYFNETGRGYPDVRVPSPPKRFSSLTCGLFSGVGAGLELQHCRRRQDEPHWRHFGRDADVRKCCCAHQ